MKIRSHLWSWALLGLAVFPSYAAAAITDADPYDQSGVSTFTDEDFVGLINVDYNSDIKDTVYPGFTHSIKYYATNGDYTSAKLEFFAYLQARQDPSATGQPKLLPIDGTAPNPATITSDLNHQFNFFKVYGDVNDPAKGGDTPPSTDPDYPYGNVYWQYAADQPTVYPSNWTQQLVRFDYLGDVVLDFALSGKTNYSEVNNMITMAWDYVYDVGRNPAAGPGNGGALQSAMRLINWTRNYFAMIGLPGTITVGTDTVVAASPQRMTGLLKYMYKMAEYNASGDNFLGITNNRGFTQAEAVFFFATYFPEFSQSATWSTRAYSRMNDYMPANIYRDGALGEPSLLYHEEQIGQLYDFQRLSIANGVGAFSADQEKLFDRMLTYWSDTVTPLTYRAGAVGYSDYRAEDYSGQTFLVGDTSLYPNFAELSAIAADQDRDNLPNYPRRDILYITSNPQGDASGLTPGHTSALYRHGVAIMRTGWDRDDRIAFIENQPPGNHSHPDDLSFSLYGYGQQLILNSGRNSYDTSSSVGLWHSDETEANSTVQIDGRPSKSFGEKINQWVHQAGFDFYDGQTTDALPPALPATDDSYIANAPASSDPATDKRLVNFGTAAAMALRDGLHTTHDNDRIAYLRFRPGTIGAALAAATLKIANLPASPPYTGNITLGVYGIHEKIPGESGQSWYDIISGTWNESNITWNANAPSHAAASGEIVTTADGGDAVFLGDVTFTGDTTWVTFGSTALRDFIASETAPSQRGMISLAITDQDAPLDKTIQLQTRKSAFRPSLALTVGASDTWTDVITHRRKVYFDRDGLFIISDLLSGAVQPHTYEQLWGLNNNGVPALDTATGKVCTQYSRIDAAGGAPSYRYLQIAPADSGSISGAALKPGYFSKVASSQPQQNFRASYSQNGSGSLTFDTVICATPGTSTPNLKVDRLSLGVATTVATALRVHLDYDAGTSADNGDVISYYLCHGATGLRTFDTYQTDGTMAAVRKTATGALATVAACNATVVMDGTNALVSATTPLTDLTVDYRTSGQLVLSSSQSLAQQIGIYSGTTITAIHFNGESVPFTQVGSICTIERKLLAAYDFENGGVANWTSSPAGGFAVTDVSDNKVYEQANTGAVDALSYIGQPHWSDYTVEATMQIAACDTGSDRVGLFGRYTSTGYYYGFVYDYWPSLLGDKNQGKLRIIKNVGGTITVLNYKNYTLTEGTPYKLKAIFDGLNLSFYINDHLELTATAQSLTTGKAGVVADRADVFFDNFTVAGLSTLPAVPAESARNVTLLPSANSYVGDCAPDTNLFDHFTGDSNARLGSETSAVVGSNRTAYVRFHLADFPGTIVSGKLRLYGNVANWSTALAAPVDVTISGIPDVAWTDRQTTWTNRPGQGAATSLGTRCVKSPGWYEFDVTSYLTAHQSDPSGEVCFMIQSTGARVDFFSDVYVQKPELVLSNQ